MFHIYLQSGTITNYVTVPATMSTEALKRVQTPINRIKRWTFLYLSRLLGQAKKFSFGLCSDLVKKKRKIHDINCQNK